MTPEEYAEKIVSDKDGVALVTRIAAQIREAQDEATYNALLQYSREAHLPHQVLVERARKACEATHAALISEAVEKALQERTKEIQASIPDCIDWRIDKIDSACGEIPGPWREAIIEHMKYLLSACYYDAAKIAEDWGINGSHSLARECGQQVALTIRARAFELTKPYEKEKA